MTKISSIPTFFTGAAAPKLVDFRVVTSLQVATRPLYRHKFEGQAEDGLAKDILERMFAEAEMVGLPVERNPATSA